MVFRTHYLLLMAFTLLLLNVVNTTGEYILGRIIKDAAHHLITSGQAGALTES